MSHFNIISNPPYSFDCRTPLGEDHTICSFATLNEAENERILIERYVASGKKNIYNKNYSLI